MSKEICTVCGREIDKRGMSGHMRTHKGKPKEGDTDGGVISYPSNEQEIEETDTVVVVDVPQGKRAARSTNAAHPKDSGVKKTVKKTQTKKKPVTSKPASSPASKPDPRGQRNSGSKSTGNPKDSGVTETEQTEDYHKAKEWKGFFRD